MAVQIRGRVRDKNSGEGMPEVLVSNGEHVVKTGADGSYALRAEVGIHPFVWVSLPDGFRATERFYRTVPATDEQIDFALVPSPERGRSDFRLAQITDTHVEEEAGARSSREVLAQDLQELVEQVKPLLEQLGDRERWGDYLEELGIDVEELREAIEEKDWDALAEQMEPLMERFNQEGGKWREKFQKDGEKFEFKFRLRRGA